MKAARIARDGSLELAEVPAPTVGSHEVVVRLAACGICGTDLEKLRGNYRTAGILGHEAVGRLEAVGAEVEGLSVGDRVFAHHHVACGHCLVCRRGDATFCPSYAATNLDPGGFAESFRVPEANVRAGAILPLGDRVDWESGTLLEPAACAFTALRRIGLPEGASVFVAGLGPVGLLYQRVAKAAGAGWIGGSELSERRRQAAERGGADLTLDAADPDRAAQQVRAATDGVGVDLAVAATGAPGALALAARTVRRGGTINLFGLPEPGSRLDLDLQALYLSGVRLVPTYATTEPDLAAVHALLSEGRLQVHDLVTDRFNLPSIDAAFRKARQPSEALKVVVTGPAYP
ncbi:MAG TPA: alcohol dehydrogenase catalytic domain-containing protein [Thermoplasmata archaeon]|nr:alcohol dehydrogenase catalytic domain-containing protein [Thermoplasmata archaeon]